MFSHAFWLFSAVLLLFSTESLASHFEEPIMDATCEHILSRSNSKAVEDELSYLLFGIPFTMATGFNGMDTVTEKMGFSADFQDFDGPEFNQLILSVNHAAVSPDSLTPVDPVVARLQLFSAGVLQDVAHLHFPDSTPVLWQTLRVHDDDFDTYSDSTYESIVDQHPLDETQPLKLMKLAPGDSVGFSTDPDADDVRRYLAFKYDEASGIYSVLLGLDVPCDRLQDFATPYDYRHHPDRPIDTPAGRYCRVEVIGFSRKIF